MRSLFIFLFVFLALAPCSGEPRVYQSSDGSLELTTEESLNRVLNPHAILSLQTEDEIVVVVTKKEKSYTVTQLYDGIPSTFEQGAVCTGRVLLSVDGEEAPAFLVEGLFPPQEDSSHDSLFVVVNHGDFEYTIMVHYPKLMGTEGFEWATAFLGRFRWTSPSD